MFTCAYKRVLWTYAANSSNLSSRLCNLNLALRSVDEIELVRLMLFRAGSFRRSYYGFDLCELEKETFG